ncbi:MAG: DUF1559 domain-containing protein [Planctomycetales bacterium]
MSDAISVECPNCQARLKLKNRNAVGKKVPCPKCQQSFVVEAPPEEEDHLAFLNVDASEGAGEPIDDDDESSATPVPSRRSAVRRGKKGKPAPATNWKKPLLIGGISLAIVGFLGGAGFLVYLLLGDLKGDGNKVNLAYLPGNSEVIVHVRVAEVWKSPLVQSVVGGPAFKNGIDKMRQDTGLEPQSIESVTVGVSGVADTIKRLPKPGPSLPVPVPTATNPNPAPAGPSGTPAEPTVTVVVIRTSTAFDFEKVRTSDRATEAVSHRGATYYKTPQSSPGSMAFYAPSSKVLVIGPESGIRQAIETGTSAPRRPELDFVDSSQQVLVAFVPKDTSVFLEVPGVSAGGPESLVKLQSTLARKIAGVALGLTAGDNIDWAVTVNCTIPEAAADAGTQLNAALQEAKDALAKQRSSAPPMLSELLNTASAVLTSMNAKSSGNVVELTGTIPSSAKSAVEGLPGMSMLGMMGGLPGMPGMAPGGAGRNPFATPPGGGPSGFGPTLGGPGTGSETGSPPAADGNPILAAREAARVAQAKNNLKQIALGLMSYHDRHNQFPDAALKDAAGQPLLSWRVAILPFIEQEALYKQFHLNEPWDSEHNKRLIEQIPATFRGPSSSAPAGSTTYLLPTGPGSIFEPGKVARFSDILDGSSNTILVVEAGDESAVPWTKPDDLAFNPQDPLKGLMGQHPGGFLAATADGAVYLFQKTLTAETLLLLFQRNDGKPVPDAGWRS